MLRNRRKNKFFLKQGFTLIELLVVMSIIGLAASIVTVNVNSARIDAKEKVVQNNAANFRLLLELEYGDAGSYFGLSPNTQLPGGATYLEEPADCDAVAFTGNYTEEALDLCKKIVAESYVSWVPYRLFVGARNPNNNDQEDGTVYSMMYGLPAQDVFYCIGSSGRSSMHPAPWESIDFWGPGCFKNP